MTLNRYVLCEADNIPFICLFWLIAHETHLKNGQSQTGYTENCVPENGNRLQLFGSYNKNENM